MIIGPLNKRITLQSPTNTADGMGGQTVTYATESVVWAAIWPISAAEIVKGTSPSMEITHRIRVRYRSGILASWRIKHGERYFNIVSIVNPNEKNEMLDLLAKESQ